jgi:hypothetical protein
MVNGIFPAAVGREVFAGQVSPKDQILPGAAAAIFT